MRFRHWIYTVPLRLRSLFWARQADDELNEELRFHIERKTEVYVNQGMSAHQARRAAILDMSGIDKVAEQCREVRRVSGLQDLLLDLRYTLRTLRKAPTFTFIIVLTLALGVGANTAVFSVVYSVLFRPLPYPNAQQLTTIFESNQREAVKDRFCSFPELKALQESGVFAQVAGVARHDLTLTGSGEPAVVKTVAVTAEIFPLLNINPLGGRYLLPDDGMKGATPVVVLSEGLWRSRFGTDPRILNRAIILDQRAFTVVGIMPASFHVPVPGPRQDIWIPVVQDPLFSALIPNRGIHGPFIIARLRDTASLASAQSALDAVSAHLASDFPVENGGWSIQAAPLQPAIVRGTRAPLLVLLGSVGFVLLLACINIANLLLARATSRTREIALRKALGANRGRIIRQLLTEAALLGTLGTILGIVLAYWSAHSLFLLLPAELQATHQVQLDGWVLLFAVLLSMTAILAFGLVPAIWAANSNVEKNLKDGASYFGTSGSRIRIRSFLAGAEIALATVLVVAAGLLVRSLISMTSVDPGFEASHVLKAEVSLPRYRYSTPQQWTAFSNTLLDRVQAQPGMKDSALAVPLPLTDTPVNLKFSIAGRPPLPSGTPSSADYVSVSTAYFHVMGIPLLRGRLFTDEDSSSSPAVTIISESFARGYFQKENPVGQKLVFGFLSKAPMPHEIVGVVGNVRDGELTKDPGPMMYVPFVQEPFWGGELVIRSTLPPSVMVGSIREVVRSIDKDLPVTDIATFPDVLHASVAQPRLRTWLLSVFGVIALLLAAAGVFGVVSYSVASRTREFGIRAALGASPGTIGKLILSEGLGLAASGLVVGITASLALTRFLRSELYGVGSYDPATFLAGAAMLLSVAVIACFLPARRAMWVDPMITLRCE